MTYRNIHVHNTIRSPDHAAWKWLAKRHGRVAGLVLKVLVSSGAELVYDQGEQQGGQPAGWEGPWQSLATVQDLQLTLWIGRLDLPEPNACQWLTQHSHLLADFSTSAMVDLQELTLESLSGALAPCKALELRISHPSIIELDVSSLGAVNSCLVTLDSKGSFADLRGVATFACLTKLTGLTLENYSCTVEDPWPALAALSSLKDLRLTVYAFDDPSPLSALTCLTSLYICSHSIDDGELVSSFSSLQPLSTMQQLVRLELVSACTATSLNGLAGLSNLRSVRIFQARALLSLEGLPGGLEDLVLTDLDSVEAMAGLENLSSLRDLSISWCGDASLQRLSGLSNLSSLRILDEGAWTSQSTGSLSSLEGIEGLGNCLKSLQLHFCRSLRSLSGIQGLTAIEDIYLNSCGVTSLHALAGLVAPGLKEIYITGSSGLEEEHLGLPPEIAAFVSIL